MTNRRCASRLSAAALAATVLTVLCGAPVIGAPKKAPAPRTQAAPRVTLDLDRTDLTLALKRLFGTARRNYVLQPGVAGQVTVKLTNTPFETALNQLLLSSSVPASYRVSNGVYVIAPKPRQRAAAARIDLQADETDVRKVLKQLFEMAGQNYVIEPDVHGPVSLSLYDLPFRTALECAMRSAPDRLSYRVESGVYFVGRAKAESTAEADDGNVTLSYSDGDVREVLGKLFTQAHQSFSLAPDVQGRVTVGLVNVPFHNALLAVLNAAGSQLRYRVQSGVTLISAGAEGSTTASADIVGPQPARPQ